MVSHGPPNRFKLATRFRILVQLEKCHGQGKLRLQNESWVQVQSSAKLMRRGFITVVPQILIARPHVGLGCVLSGLWPR